MADDVTLNSMSGGAVVATDEVTGTGEHVQVVKLAYSADGSRTTIDADSNGLRVWSAQTGLAYTVGDTGLPALAVDPYGNWITLGVDYQGNLNVAPKGTVEFTVDNYSGSGGYGLPSAVADAAGVWQPLRASSGGGLRTSSDEAPTDGDSYSSYSSRGFPAFAANPTSNWEPVRTDSSGNLRVSVDASPNPITVTPDTSGPAFVVAPGGGAAFPVDDNGGSLTVDGTVAATQSGSWTVTANAGSGTMAVVERGATINHGSTSVTTTQVSLLSAGTARRSVTIQNLGTDYVWLGATGITANNGLRLAPGQTATIDKSPNAQIFAIASSGTQTVALFWESD